VRQTVVDETLFGDAVQFGKEELPHFIAGRAGRVRRQIDRANVASVVASRRGLLTPSDLWPTLLD